MHKENTISDLSNILNYLKHFLTFFFHIVHDMSVPYIKNKKNLFKIISKLDTYSDISTIASISVMELSGKFATPTAILECFPFSPKISKSKSEAALITFGC